MTRKARGPEILNIPSRRKFVVYPSGDARIVPCNPIEPFYPDRRIAPRRCERTGMNRAYCCCARCRALRRRKHSAVCRCWLCFADRTGEFIDQLGERTAAGRFVVFLTLTYRTQNFPWSRGFPIAQPQPHVEFVRNFVGYMIRHLQNELSEQVDYFQAEQFGSVGGRIHQHFGLSALGLIEPARELARNLAAGEKKLPERLKPFQAFLWGKAGFNRILPWEEDAGYYIGRYIGRDAHRCELDFNVVAARTDRRETPPVGRIVVARSPDLPSTNYRNILRRRHR
jgi:hypothetical protein